MVRLMQTSQHGEATGQVYFRTANGFPVVDFVTSLRGGVAQNEDRAVVQERWNAKVGAAKPAVSSSAFMRLMKNLGLVNSSGVRIDANHHVRFKLTMLCSARKSAGFQFVDTHRNLRGEGIGNFEQANTLFDECIEVVCVDALAWKGQWRTWREGRMRRVKALVAEYTNVPGTRLGAHATRD